MSLLSEAPIIEGLRLREQIISDAAHDALTARLDLMALAPFRFQGWIGNRKTSSFGWLYDFDDSSFRPSDPLPDWLMPLREQAAQLAAVTPDQFVHVLVARYDPGAGIGWHRDRPVFGQVVGISLGSAATLRFRQRTPAGFRRASVRLEPRSAYLLSGEARHEWEHSIVPGEQLRFSITLRTLSDLGVRKAAEFQRSS